MAGTFLRRVSKRSFADSFDELGNSEAFRKSYERIGKINPSLCLGLEDIAHVASNALPKLAGIHVYRMLERTECLRVVEDCVYRGLVDEFLEHEEYAESCFEERYADILSGFMDFLEFRNPLVLETLFLFTDRAGKNDFNLKNSVLEGVYFTYASLERQKKKDVAKMRFNLRLAIRDERYELAARLRDSLRAMIS